MLAQRLISVEPCAPRAPPPPPRCAGGTARCPGFRERLYNELRPLVPDDYEVSGSGGGGRRSSGGS